MTKSPTILAAPDEPTDRQHPGVRETNNALAGLVRVGWIGTVIAVSIDILSASAAVAIGVRAAGDGAMPEGGGAGVPGASPPAGATGL